MIRALRGSLPLLGGHFNCFFWSLSFVACCAPFPKPAAHAAFKALKMGYIHRLSDTIGLKHSCLRRLCSSAHARLCLHVCCFFLAGEIPKTQRQTKPINKNLNKKNSHPTKVCLLAPSAHFLLGTGGLVVQGTLCQHVPFFRAVLFLQGDDPAAKLCCGPFISSNASNVSVYRNRWTCPLSLSPFHRLFLFLNVHHRFSVGDQ